MPHQRMINHMDSHDNLLDNPLKYKYNILLLQYTAPLCLSRQGRIYMRKLLS